MNTRIARRTALLLFVLAAAMPGAAAAAPSAEEIQLFGAKLRGASRAALRTALAASPLKPQRVDDQYWVDTYDASAALEGATELQVGYVGETGTFAFARYTFEAFMDTDLVARVARLVATKYGPASSTTGRVDLGPAGWTWTLPQGMTIRVERGWPDTTTYLSFTDKAAYSRMQREMDDTQRERERAKARGQSKAF